MLKMKIIFRRKFIIKIKDIIFCEDTASQHLELRKASNMYSEVFASRLKNAREQTGFTQMEVYKELHIGQENLSKYETGKAEPDLQTLANLANFYGVTVDWLIGIELENRHYIPKYTEKTANVIYNVDFPQKLKIERAKAKVPQTKVAKALKLSNGTYAKYELGQFQPSIETLAKIARYYKVSANWLLGLEDKEGRQK
jgi:transcriptional regulator with XRE-family HTH domain